MSHNSYPGIDLNAIDVFTLADLVNQPIHITTPDGILRFVNNSWSAVYGISKEDAIGHRVADLLDLYNYKVDFDDLMRFDMDAFSEAMKQAPIKESAVDFVLQKGEQVTMLNRTPFNSNVIVTSTPIFNDKHEISMVFTLIQDLTLLAGWHDYMQSALQKSEAVQQELANLRSSVGKSHILGNSREINELRRLISIVAPSDASILISGESGTGKEVVAKQVFSESHRNDKPFVTVNCAAIPENLLESELFGHEKGSFTGATSTKIGLFEVANHGTILLDEIGEFPILLQPKLLRALQEKEIRRVGGNKNIPIDVRVISATNQDLEDMVRQGKFRMDLYYRLNVFPLSIPPLRDRRVDIAVLAAHFLEKFNKKYNRKKTFSHKAIASLEKYSWPGNVRELENIVERLVIVGESPTISADQVNYIMIDQHIKLEKKKENIK